MRGKRARLIRKITGTKLPVKADLRILNEIEKMVYYPNPVTGEMEMTMVKRQVILNAAKHGYNSAKKKLKGIKIPNTEKNKNTTETEVGETNAPV